MVEVSKLKIGWGHALLVLLLVAAGIALRFTAALHFSHGNLDATGYPDERNYYLPAAREILEQGIAFFQTPRALWNGPLNPLWVALWQASVSATKVANILLLGLCGFCVWDIGRKLFGLGAAYLSLLFFLVYPPLLEFGGTILTEPLFVSLILFGTWMLVCQVCGARYSPVLAGVLFGLAILTRPTLQLFPIFLAVLALSARFLPRRSPLLSRDAERSLLVFALFTLLTVVPYNLKNYLYFGKLGIANGFGAVLFLGNDLRTAGDEPIYSQMGFDTFQLTKPYSHLDTEGDRILSAAALQKIAAQPAQIFLLTLMKPFKYLFGHPQHYFYPNYDVLSYYHAVAPREFWIKLGTIFLTCLIVSFAFCGLIFLPMQPCSRLLFAAFSLYMVGLHAVAFPLPRLALPLFPVLMIVAAGALIVLPKLQRWTALLVGLAVFVTSSAYILFAARGTNRAEVTESVLGGFSKLREVPLSAATPKSTSEDEGSAFSKKEPFNVALIEPIPAVYNQVVFMEIRATGKKAPRPDLLLGVRVMWAANPELGVGGNRSGSLQVRADGKFRWYRLSPSSNPEWKGNLDAFRIEMEGKGNGHIRRLIVAE